MAAPETAPPPHRSRDLPVHQAPADSPGPARPFLAAYAIGRSYALRRCGTASASVPSPWKSADARAAMRKSDHRIPAYFRGPLSSAQDASRAAQCAHSKTHVVPRKPLSSHFDAQLCLGRTRCVAARARSWHHRSRSSLGHARSICRPARSIVGPSRSAICKVWYASGRARPKSRAATCPRAGSRCIASAARSTLSRARSALRRSKSTRAQTKDTHFTTRTARAALRRPSPPYYLPPLHLLSADRREGPASSCRSERALVILRAEGPRTRGARDLLLTRGTRADRTLGPPRV